MTNSELNKLVAEYLQDQSSECGVGCTHDKLDVSAAMAYTTHAEKMVPTGTDAAASSATLSTLANGDDIR